MQYKIICSDLDGTLLSTKNDVSDFTISEIARIKKQSKIILVSARMPQAIRYLQKRLGIEEEPIICYNGALVITNKNEIFSKTIEFEGVEKVYRYTKDIDIKLGLYFNREWYVEEISERVQKEIDYTRTSPIFRPTLETLIDWKSRNISAHKIMLMCTKSSADLIFPTLLQQLGTKMNIYRSNDTLIELAPKSVSKLSAIQFLLPANETMADVISFGDNFNDIEMLQNSGLGVAVGNAREEVKKIANKVTLKNTEDGVAYFIKHNLI